MFTKVLIYINTYLNDVYDNVSDKAIKELENEIYNIA